MPNISEYTQQPKQDFLGMAIEQLDIAIDLFLSGRSYVAALTLAHAAETVFGNVLKKNGQLTALDGEFEQIDASEQQFPFFGIYPRDASEHRRRGAFKEFKYRGRNLANHGPGRPPEFKAYQRVIPPGIPTLAEEAIERALANAERLGLVLPEGAGRYYDWFQDQISN
jgi:hypothetical protein